MATLGLIPDPKRVMQLRILYGKSSDYIKQQIFSIDILNYTDVLANKIRRNIDIEVQKLNLQAMRWSKVAIPESYNQSVAVNKKILTDSELKPDPNYNTDIHQVTKDKSISVTQKILLKANRSIMPQITIYLKILKDAHRSIVRADLQELGIDDKMVINEIIAEGVGEELSGKQIAREIERYLRFKFKNGEFIVINGRNYQMKAYSEMVARTQMRLTQSLATENMGRQFNNDLVVWSIHTQDHPDDLCAPYAGKVYSLSGNNKVYRKIPARPPTHPNCKHNITSIPQALVDIEPERFPSTLRQSRKRAPILEQSL